MGCLNLPARTPTCFAPYHTYFKLCHIASLATPTLFHLSQFASPRPALACLIVSTLTTGSHPFCFTSTSSIQSSPCLAPSCLFTHTTSTAFLCSPPVCLNFLHLASPFSGSHCLAAKDPAGLEVKEPTRRLVCGGDRRGRRVLAGRGTEGRCMGGV